MGLQHQVSFRIEDEGLITAVATDRLLFRTGSAVISPYGRTIIGALAPTLTALTNEVLVEGHTDNVPLNDPGYNNWNLSTDRAVAVVRLLQEAFDIDPARLVAVGYGEYQPRATNDTVEGRSLNRRVELLISTDMTTTEAAAADAPAAEPSPQPSAAPTAAPSAQTDLPPSVQPSLQPSVEPDPQTQGATDG